MPFVRPLRETPSEMVVEQGVVYQKLRKFPIVFLGRLDDRRVSARSD